MWHNSCIFNSNDTDRGGRMAPALRETTASATEPRRAGFLKQALHKHLYLLEKSLDRFGHLKEMRAPAIFLAQEKALIHQQLLFLYNLREKLM
jgi:hypothetical protein